nr:PREDICTED: uncharacterized protein LOC109033700 [Bemisia tabaci]
MVENTDHSNLIRTASSEFLKSNFDPDEKEIDRLEKFKECVRETVKEVACRVTFERFNSIVSDLKVFQQKSRSAVKMHNMLKTNIESKCMSDLDDMIEEAGFPEKFQQLSQIVEQNAPYVGEKAWRPTGNTKDDLRTQRVMAKLKQIEELEKKVLAKEATAESLRADVTTIRQKASYVNAEITSILGKAETTCDEKLKKIHELTESTSVVRAEDDQNNKCVMR